jgi:2-polyprenyl-3-methyl-5-hydroxy-6-metoxy-1,4-benzoquinol methylase
MIKNRGYQRNFSKIFPAAMSDSQGREKKAKTMVAVLSDYLRSDLKSFSVLDIGSSTGIIANYLSKYFGKVVGIDIDKNAIEYAKNNFKKDNLQFAISDSMNMDYPDNSFDVVICAHVYEHVPDADRLMTEIRTGFATFPQAIG